MPLQLSSMPLHTSVCGGTFSKHCSLPSLQCSVPAAQMLGRPVLHMPPPPGSPSSITPLQSSSMKLHCSGVGFTFGMHTNCVPTHCTVPCAHGPGLPVGQA